MNIQEGFMIEDVALTARFSDVLNPQSDKLRVVNQCNYSGP